VHLRRLRPLGAYRRLIMITFAIGQASPKGELWISGERWVIAGLVDAEDAKQAVAFWRTQRQPPYQRIIATNTPVAIVVANARYIAQITAS